MSVIQTKTLRDLCQNIRCEIVGSPKLSYDKQDKWQRESNGYRLELRRGRKRMSLDFWQGIGINHDPEAYTVLDCLLSDASSADQSFEDWCSDYGYDVDSRKAERTYKSIQAQTKRLQRFLEEDYETFLYADR